MGDFNGDGKSDLVMVDGNVDTTSILLGNGNGMFQARQSFSTGDGPRSVVVADFNGDGGLDLATANYYDNTASVLLGNGDGTFRAKQLFGTAIHSTWVAAGDFNGDGNSDLVTTDADINSVSVLLGNATTQTTTVTTDCLQPITGLSLATQDDAILAQDQIQGYQNGLSVVAGATSAVLSRFQIAVQLTTSTADAFKDAEVRITDIDVATDVATLVRKQIIQQAATAMLAQANQQPALVLSLLRE